MSERLRILFVCTGNICRSPMAEGMARARIAKRYPYRAGELAISSAGIAGLDGETASLEAVMTMRERGVDITAHRARSVTRELLESSDLVLTMEVAQTERLRAMQVPTAKAAPESGPGSPDNHFSPPVFSVSRLGEVARRAMAEQGDLMRKEGLSIRLERLVRTADVIRLEGSWELPDFTYEISDPMGSTLSRYAVAAEAMEGPINDILDFLLS